MSKLNDLNNDLYTMPNTADQILRAWGDRIRRLANNSRVETDILQVLVCSAIKLEEITNRRACEILGFTVEEFHNLYNHWEVNYQNLHHDWD